MFELALVWVACASASPSPAEVASSAGLDGIDREFLARAGIAIEAPAPTCTATDGAHSRPPARFEIAGLGQRAATARETAGEIRLRFEPLRELGVVSARPTPCTACGWDGGAPDAPARTLGFAAPRLVPTPAEFVLTQARGETLAKGTLTLASSADPVSISAVRSGCGMQHEPAAPFQVGTEPLLVAARIDLRNRQRADNLCVSLLFADGARQSLPLRIEVDDPPFTLAPDSTFASRPGETTQLAIRANGERSIRSVAIVRRPACVALARGNAQPTEITLAVTTTAAARIPHRCGVVQGTVAFAGDPSPFLFAFTPDHGADVRDAEGRPLVYGAFVPGESVWFQLGANGSVRRAHPQRMAGLSPLWSFDAATTIRWTVPADARGEIDVVLASEAGSGGLHVVGFASNELGMRQTRWIEMSR